MRAVAQVAEAIEPPEFRALLAAQQAWADLQATLQARQVQTAEHRAGARE
ncbi:hypothetical protein BDSB_05490 [Burkholderia dolosa PC543]|nr:hypothetical protein BDSB_05490 [Burkholderia dolosa PC543]